MFVMCCSVNWIMAANSLHSIVHIVENVVFEKPCDARHPIHCIRRSRDFLKPISGMLATTLGLTPACVSCERPRRDGWRIAFALDTGGAPDSGGNERLDDGDNTPGQLGRTRLGRILSGGSRQLLEKLNGARRNFPMKVFLLLLGFYTANALATILGQTGDWDVLVAGIVVAAIEGIGVLMYKRPLPIPIGKLESLVGMINYWKAGLCLGLFVDAFKLGS
ncbi:ycf20-like protein isoform X2 [Amborella trichopoda]|uniref:ycf20-like protein isoform X2 n=1 Tax=Amborella trichopoda TaxID=13333 RepID=UPI0009BC8F4F|nr:ycf20-like protein isoform X2 [Amborella trichopoda]|eukprot:XP_020531321.1 ycf20-like protein isoform X2 [Amborella trichopoda]